MLIQCFCFCLSLDILEFQSRVNICLPDAKAAMPYKQVKCQYQMSHIDQPTPPEVKWKRHKLFVSYAQLFFFTGLN